MARPPRPQVAGGIYHVTSRGNRGQSIVEDNADRRQWISLLDEIVRVLHWRCYAYCLMTNHFHLLVETPEPNISKGMQRLNSLHAEWFNWRYGLKGHLFHCRFHSVLVRRESHLVELSRYVVLNPVRAGLCSRAADWRWSSYTAALGLVPCPPFLTVDWLLDQFDADPQQARRMYAVFVEQATPQT